MADDASPPSPGGYGPNPSHNEREERLLIVEEMLYRRLLSTSTIERDLSVNFGVTSRTVRTYIAMVRRRAAKRERSEAAPRIDRGSLTEALVDVYNECRNQRDRHGNPRPDNKTALRALHELGALHGLHIRKIELTGADGGPLKVSPDEAARQLREQIERVMSQQAGEAPAAKPEADDDAPPDFDGRGG